MDTGITDFDVSGLLAQSQELIALYGFKVLGAIVIFIIGRVVAGLVAKSVHKVMTAKGVDKTIVGFVHSLLYAVLLVFVLIAALGQVGIQTASFIAIIGAAGLAVGLALQGSLSNFASGVLMIIFKPFKVGDFVDAGGASGSVTELHIFSTVLTTPDNKKIIVPNTAIMSGNIVNYSAMDTRRVDLVIGVSYDAFLPLAKSVLKDEVNNEARVLRDIEPVVAVSELADSSVNFVVRVWVKRTDYWSVYFDLLENIKLRLDKENIGIPYPQLDLHVANEQLFQPTKELEHEF